MNSLWKHETTPADVIVVGGGVTGAFCAYLLSRQGLDVLVVDDRHRAGVGSRNNPGGLNPLHGPGIPGSMSDFALKAFDLHFDHASHIRELLGRKLPLRPVIRYELALDQRELDALQAMQSLYDETRDFSASRLDRATFLALEPQANPAVLAALRLEGNAVVDGAAYTDAILDASGLLGARGLSTRMRGFLQQGERVIGVMTDEGPLHAGRIVLAAGAWLGQLLAELGISFPVAPVKGQLLHISDPGRRSCTHHLSCGGTGLYALGAGEFLIGGTQEQAGFDGDATADGREDLWRQAERLVPAIRTSETLDQLVGFRPTTPDLQPFAGPIPGFDNLMVAGGGWSKGMLYAPALAAAAVATLMGSSSCAELPSCLQVHRLLNMA